MKYCSHCGKELLDDAVICPGCGCGVQYGGTPNPNPNNGAYRPQPPKAQPVPPPVADSCSALSIVGFVLCFVWSLIGLIISIVAHNEAKRIGSQKSESLSKAGIIVSAVILGLAVLAIIFFFFLPIFIAVGTIY